MNIPFIDMNREWNFFEQDFLDGFKQFGNAGNYVLGPFTETFEQHFAAYCGYTHAVSVSTGLAALEISLRAHGIQPGDEVITVPNSAVATSLAISNVGSVPVFCDIGDDFLIDVQKIEALITKKTKAILPVHLFGKICDMETIANIAGKHDLKIIEDACQAHGATFQDDSVQHTKAFSFYPTKNLGSMGEGGMVVTNDKTIADYVTSYRNYGQQGRYNHVIKGSNHRINALQCVFLDRKLQSLNEFIEKRRQIAKTYIEALEDIGDIVVLPYDTTSAYHLFVIRVLKGKRDALKSYLTEHGIDTLIHYPTTIPKQPCYQGQYQKVVPDKTEQFQKEILSLPCYPFLSQEEQNEIIQQIRLFFT